MENTPLPNLGLENTVPEGKKRKTIFIVVGSLILAGLMTVLFTGTNLFKGFLKLGSDDLEKLQECLTIETDDIFVDSEYGVTLKEGCEVELASDEDYAKFVYARFEHEESEEIYHVTLRGQTNIPDPAIEWFLDNESIGNDMELNYAFESGGNKNIEFRVSGTIKDKPVTLVSTKTIVVEEPTVEATTPPIIQNLSFIGNVDEDYIFNGTTVLDPLGVSFNGTSDYAESKTEIDLSKYNKLTVSFWWRSGDDDDKPHIIAEFSPDYNFTTGNFVISQTEEAPYAPGHGGKLGVSMHHGSYVNWGTDFIPEKQKWYHVTATMDRTAEIKESVKLYIDGKLNGSNFIAWEKKFPGNFGKHKLYLGGRGKFQETGKPDYFSNIDLAEFNIYGGLLTPEQIEAKYEEDLKLLPELEDTKEIVEPLDEEAAKLAEAAAAEEAAQLAAEAEVAAAEEAARLAVEAEVAAAEEEARLAAEAEAAAAEEAARLAVAEAAAAADTIGHWKLDEAAGATSFIDSSEGNNNGSCSNDNCPEMGTDGHLATAGNFDGDDYIEIPSIGDLDGFKISAWIKPKFNHDDNTKTTNRLFSARGADNLSLIAGYDNTRDKFYLTQIDEKNWENTGKLAGVTNISALIQASDGTLYVGTSLNGAGAIFKSTDGGTTWEITGDLAGTKSVQKLTQGSDGTLYAAASQSGLVAGVFNTLILESTDLGTSWQKKGELADVRIVFSLFQGSDGVLYTGTWHQIQYESTVGIQEIRSGRVFKSRDHGSSWENTGELASTEKVVIIQGSDGTLYIGTAKNGAAVILKSIDGGASWENTGELAGQTIVDSILQTSDGTLLAGTYPRENIFKSTDDGTTWEKLSIPGATRIFSLIQGSDGALYAGTYPYGRIYKSTDDGTSWEILDYFDGVDGASSLLQGSDGALYAGTYLTRNDERSLNRTVFKTATKKIESSPQSFNSEEWINIAFDSNGDLSIGDNVVATETALSPINISKLLIGGAKYSKENTGWNGAIDEFIIKRQDQDNVASLLYTDIFYPSLSEVADLPANAFTATTGDTLKLITFDQPGKNKVFVRFNDKQWDLDILSAVTEETVTGESTATGEESSTSEEVVTGEEVVIGEEIVTGENEISVDLDTEVEVGTDVVADENAEPNENIEEERIIREVAIEDPTKSENSDVVASSELPASSDTASASGTSGASESSVTSGQASSSATPDSSSSSGSSSSSSGGGGGGGGGGGYVSNSQKTVLRKQPKETSDVKTSSVEVNEVIESSKFSCLTNGDPISFSDNNTDEVKLLSSLQYNGKPIIQGFAESGNNIYGGTYSATRSQVLKTLMISGCMSSEVNSDEKSVYKDVSKEQWHYNFVLSATRKGVVEGYNEKGGRLFKPDKTISRIEALKMISIISGIKKAPEDCEKIPFADIDETHWGYEISRDAFCSNLVVGKTVEGKRYLYGNEDLTRTDLAIWLSNAMAINIK